MSRCRKCRGRIAACAPCLRAVARRAAAEQAQRDREDRFTEVRAQAERERYQRACARLDCGQKYDAKSSPSIFYCGTECEAADFADRKQRAASSLAQRARAAGADLDVGTFTGAT